jgi:hypothetical protein
MGLRYLPSVQRHLIYSVDRVVQNGGTAAHEQVFIIDLPDHLNPIQTCLICLSRNGTGNRAQR